MTAPFRIRCFEEDLCLIDNKPHKMVFRNSEGLVLAPLEGGLAQTYTHDELLNLNRHNRFEVKLNYFVNQQGRPQEEEKSAPLVWDSGAHDDRIRFRESIVLAVDLLRRRQKEEFGKIRLTLTDDGIEAHRLEIKEEAKAFYCKVAQTQDSKTKESPEKFSPRSLRRWIAAYKQFGRVGLSDRSYKSGSRFDQLNLEVRRALNDAVMGYLTTDRLTKKAIHEDLKATVATMNEQRVAEGLKPFRVPCRNTVSAAIDRLDPFLVMVAREGRDAALRKLRQTGRGQTRDLVRPLQVVEMDENKVDLITLFRDNGLLDRFSEEERKRLGLEGKKGRWWITVAICAATRVIVGMRLSKSPSRFSAIECLEMCVNDKGGYADAVGALTGWDFFGLPERLVTDGGSAFKADEFRKTCAALDVPFEIAVNGVPHLRGTIERVFRSMNLSLLPRLTGRTFSNVILRGENDSVKEGVLSADEFAYALVRWAVDIYHNQPHEGLGGDTPIEAWNKAMEEYGVRAAPGPEKQAQIFARPLTRKLEGDGITVLGVRYHSKALAKFALHSRALNRKTSDRQVEVRWHPRDLGAIWVKADQWIKVPAVFDGFAGVSAAEWLESSSRLRLAQHKRQEVSQTVVCKAIADIKQLNATARQRARLVTEVWEEAALARLEESLFVGFSVSETSEAPATAQAEDGVGLRIVPDASAEAVEPEVAAPTVKKGRSRSKKNDAWGVED